MYLFKTEMLDVLPQTGDIVKCIKSVRVVTNPRRSSNEEEQFFQYEEGNLYSIHANKQVHVEINTDEKKNGYSWSSSYHGGFVSDAKMYEGIPFSKHFELHKLAKDVKLYKITKKVEGRYKNGYYVREVNNIETEVVTSYTKNSWTSISPTDQFERITFTNLISIKFYSNVHRVTIEGYTKVIGEDDRIEDDPEPKIFDKDSLILPSKLKELNIINQDDQRKDKRFPIHLDFVDIPKSTEKIRFENVHSNYIKTEATSIVLKHCSVGHLEVDVNRITNLVLMDTDVHISPGIEIFQEPLSGCGTVLTVVKLGDDAYVTSFTGCRLTEDEVSTHCHTLQLIKTIAHFNLPSAKFKFLQSKWDREPIVDQFIFRTVEDSYYVDRFGKEVTEEVFKFLSWQDREKVIESNKYEKKIKSGTQKVMVSVYNNELVIFNHNTSNTQRTSESEFVITLDTDNRIKVYLYNYNHYKNDIVLSNKIFNRFAKFSEHEQLPPLFFDNLFNHPAVAFVKNTGMVDIKDFDFSMLDVYDMYRDCELIYFNNKAWHFKKKIKGSGDRHKDDRNGEGKIEWTNVGFELSSKGIEDNSYYVRPGIEDYWEKIVDIKDLYYLLHNELDWVKYDESRVYVVPNTDALIRQEDGYLYKGCIYYNMTGREDIEYHGNSTYVGNYYVNVKDMENFAKAHKMKLDPHNVEMNSGQIAVYRNWSRQFESDSDVKAIMEHLFHGHRSGNVVFRNPDIQRTDIPFVCVAGKLYQQNKNQGSKFELVGEYTKRKYGDRIYVEAETVDIIDAIIDGNYRYNFVNIDVPLKLRRDCINFVEKHRSILSSEIIRSADQRLGVLFRLIAYGKEWPMKYFSGDEKHPVITADMQDEWEDLKSKLADCFKNTKKRLAKGPVAPTKEVEIIGHPRKFRDPSDTSFNLRDLKPKMTLKQ